MLNLEIKSHDDAETIMRIAQRARAIAQEIGVPYSTLEAAMDVTAAHNTTPLMLHELLDAPQGDFAHDVFGIRRHLNRETGQLEDSFMPRYSVH